MLTYLKMAGRIALPNNPADEIRNFYLGAVGIREDGVIVQGKNGVVHSTEVDNFYLIPESHAEGRVLRKLGKNGTIYVARIAKTKPKAKARYAMAAPCGMCQIRIRSFGVEKVFYTINDSQYGLWNVKKDTHKVYNS